MLKKIANFIKNNNLIITEPIICAVSGGVDSVSLIDILHKLGYKIVLAHVNHNKREQSKIEQEAMKNLALKLDIPFELLDYHYDGIDNFHNDSHNARYDFFKGLCEKYNTNTIATAHHSDDQIETVLMKIMEGSNLYGYGGISIINDDGTYRIIRPLLCVSKKELYDYAKNNNLKYFEDSSNFEDDFLRNRMRHHVVPMLKEESLDLNNKILEYSIQLHEAFDFIRGLSHDFLNKYNNRIYLEEFNKLNIALKKDIISLLLEKYNIRKTYDIINNILSVINTNDGEKRISLNNNYCFIKSYEYAKVEKIKEENILDETLDLTSEVIYNDKYKFYFSKKIPLNNAKYLKLCYNNLKLPLHIRSKVDGDFIKLNLGNKKVSRIFIDSKVESNLRKYVPIITDNDNNILWVYDYAKSKEVFDSKENSDIYLVCEVL